MPLRLQLTRPTFFRAVGSKCSCLLLQLLERWQGLLSSPVPQDFLQCQALAVSTTVTVLTRPASGPQPPYHGYSCSDVFNLAAQPPAFMMLTIKRGQVCRGWWHTPAIPAFGRWRKGDQEFKPPLSYRNSCLKNKQQKNRGNGET